MNGIIPLACALTVPDRIGFNMMSAARKISMTDNQENAFKHKLKRKASW